MNPLKHQEDVKMASLETAHHEAELGQQLADMASAELDQEFSPRANVVDLAGKRVSPAALDRSPAGGSLDDHADFHRKAAAEYDHRKGQALRDGKAAAAAFRAERKALRDQYNAELAALAEREEQTKAEIAQRVTTADCLAEVSRAAVRTIEKHL